MIFGNFHDPTGPSFPVIACVTMVTRRQFSQAIAGMLAASRVSCAQTAAPDLWAGASIVDCHHHLRPSPEANIAHLDGAAISNALALARASSAGQMQALETQYPGRFLGWFASADITRPDAVEVLTSAVNSGAVGLGELKFHVEAAGPELRRMYALAAELNIPILIHFQAVPHTPPAGVTDKLLADYPNLYGCLSANSGNNALSRDPAFTADFLKRHQDKLIFGSDCACTDGHGGGISQGGNPTAARMAGKCVARETLTLLHKSAPPAAFQKMTWQNAHRVYKLKA